MAWCARSRSRTRSAPRRSWTPGAVAFQIPDVIFQVLAGATMGSAFIPVFARLAKNEGEERAWRLASAVLTTVTTATAILCLLGFILAPVLVPVLAPGLGEDIGRRDELVAEAVSLTRLMLLSPLLFSMSGMVTGILNARQHFLLPAIAPMLYNLAIIFGAMVLAEPFGVQGLSYGVIGGAALHLGVQVPGLVRHRMRFRPRFDWADSATREVARLMGPRIIGLGAVQANLFVTIFFASKVASGAINVMNYAFIISQLPLGIFGMALATAAFPRLAEQVAEGNLQALQDTVSRVLRMILFLTVPTAIGLALLREPVTVFLLQGGAFTSADSVLVATALGWYCLGIVPQAGVEIHSRGFYALGDTRTPVAMTVVSLLTNLVLAWLLWERFEYAGLGFAVSAAAWMEWGLLYALYVRRTGASPAPDLRVGARIALAAGVMAVGVALARRAVRRRGPDRRAGGDGGPRRRGSGALCRGRAEHRRR
ncbi:MAG: murein biosynthesis integral membrane protein MurJ [Dehalococcoidia bacterium]|nr:murein biosynthesis integral membrane protein MurJ [Dehalococcoidia bacterium]